LFTVNAGSLSAISVTVSIGKFMIEQMKNRDAASALSRGPLRRLFGRPYLFALIMAGIAVVLLWGGGELLALGGSPYYFIAGLLVGGSAMLVATGRWRGAQLYFLMILGTIIWAIWESGANSWALAARIAAPAVFGLWFLVPWTRRRLGRTESPHYARGAISIVAAVAIGGLLHAAVGQSSVDPMFQAGVQQNVPARSRTVAAPGADWATWGGTEAGERFSGLDQLTPDNVSGLQLAWVHRLGPPPAGAPASLEATPLKIGDRLFICTDYNDIVALDAETGRQVWRFRAQTDVEGKPYGHCRGVTYFRVPAAVGPCAERIYTNTIDARLIAVDAATGRACGGFGEKGVVDLMRGMSPAPKGYYIPTSAPLLARGRLVIGGWVSDGQYWGEPSGVIRAFDAVTGRLDWAFDMGHPDRRGEPPPGEYYTPGTPNAWAPMSSDDRLGLVYAPLGGASLDYSSEQRRPFDNAYSGSVLALDVETGRPRWRFQTTHKDLWDYDVASQPTLIDYPTPGGLVPAILQPTKRGELFVLDRATGRPLAPVTEHRVPTSGTAPGEVAWPTQPFSDSLPSFRGVPVTERSMWGLTPLDQLSCRIKFRQARYEGPMTPPGLAPSIASPGFLGGMNWGGASIDPERGIAVVNTNHVANYTQMFPRSAVDDAGVKPAGMGGTTKPEGVGMLPQAGTRYGVKALPFLSFLYAPCQQPPWGRISAIDLRTRKLIWSHPIGTARDSGPLGLPSLLPFRIGTPNLGGSVVTRGGLIFIAATQDNYLRAVDLSSGKVLWRGRLGTGAQATPSTYWSEKSGRQMVTVVAGGHAFLGTKPGDYVYAFALPKGRR
jgi:quinoprotein glucose dehydrogenase